MLLNNNYTSITDIVDDVREHPLMKNYSLSNIIKNTVKFIGLMGCDALYDHKTEVVEIENNHGVLQCDAVAIQFVKDNHTKLCLRKASGAFGMGIERYKVNGRDIYVSDGIKSVTVAYTAIRTDDEGLPMILDIEQFKVALVNFIKQEYFRIQFECGKINVSVFNSVQQEYTFSAAALNSVLTLPDFAEMENIGNELDQFIPNDNYFKTGFEDYGNPEIIRRH